MRLPFWDPKAGGNPSFELIAALSEPLCAALYGDFKEATTREITLPDVNEDAFDVMLRTSHNLDPSCLLLSGQSLHSKLPSSI